MQLSTKARTATGTGLGLLLSAGIGYIGIGYLTRPAGMAPTFVGRTGLDSAHFLGNAKGVRDLLTGIVCAGFMLKGSPRAAGWSLITAAAIPAGDTAVVLTHGGDPRTAWGVHAATAAAYVVAGGLLVSADGRSRDR